MDTSMPFGSLVVFPEHALAHAMFAGHQWQHRPPGGSLHAWAGARPVVRFWLRWHAARVPARRRLGALLRRDENYDVQYDMLSYSIIYDAIVEARTV